jgi:DUF1365 family protein
MTPARYDAVISHARRAPIGHRFRHRASYWLVDLADLPWPQGLLGRLARIDARDHIDVRGLLRARGVEVERVLMLAAARSWGHVFNPISVCWCYDATGALAAVVAEVRNTYGDAHPYVLEVDDAGRAETDKQLYVSPFYPVDGRYRIRASPPGERAAVAVTLIRDGDEPFSASLLGHRRPASRRALVGDAFRHPSWRVSALIRWHGIGLWARGLPIHPRPRGGSRPAPAGDPS